MVKNVETEEIQNESWYNYDIDHKQWANAKSADGSLWVWIPRFAYKITKPTEGQNAGTIDIVFLKGTTDNPVDGSTGVTIKRATDAGITDGDYIVHPAFTDESASNYANGGWDKEIPGFWMAKFEAGYAGSYKDPSSAKDSNVAYSSIRGEYNNLTENYYGKLTEGSTLIKYPEFMANKPSFGFIAVGDSFQLCRKLTEDGNPYGFTKKVDSHLTKNSEWGAVAYLSWSKYGTNGEVIGVNASEAYGKDGVYCVTGYGSNAPHAGASKDGLINGTADGNWLTENGKQASTTQNISGIYDMSGGSAEWVACCMIDQEPWTNQFNKYMKNILNNNKYLSMYKHSSSSNDRSENFNANLGRYGEGIFEVSSGDGTSWSGRRTFRSVPGTVFNKR